MHTNLNPSHIILIEGPLCPTSFGNLGNASLEVSADGRLRDNREGVPHSWVALFESLPHDKGIPVVHDHPNGSGVSYGPLLSAEGKDGCGLVALAEYATP